MRRGTSTALIVALVVVLFVLLLGQLVVVPGAASRAVESFPEVEPFAGLGIAWAVLAVACVQVVALCSIFLIAATRGPRALWRRGVQAATLALLALIIVAIVALNTLAFATPGAMLALITGGVAALVGFGVFTVTQHTERAGRLRFRS